MRLTLSIHVPKQDLTEKEGIDFIKQAADNVLSCKDFSLSGDLEDSDGNIVGSWEYF